MYIYILYGIWCCKLKKTSDYKCFFVEVIKSGEAKKNSCQKKTVAGNYTWDNPNGECVIT